jgi:hypothetical protein
MQVRAMCDSSIRFNPVVVLWVQVQGMHGCLLAFWLNMLLTQTSNDLGTNAPSGQGKIGGL